jgi:Spherulation-specific family 4
MSLSTLTSSTPYSHLSKNRISGQPNLDFLVILNPNSGPGDIVVANKDYTREIPKLNAYANVVTVGYIRIDYCRRPLSEVCAEIDTYAGWAAEYEKTGLGVGGILLDETPNHYTAQRAEYLDAVRQHVKATPGIQGERLVCSPLSSIANCREEETSFSPNKTKFVSDSWELS